MRLTRTGFALLACAATLTINIAAADDDDDDRQNDFRGRPDFRAVLTPVETGNPATEGFSAIARFWLNDDQTRLKYRIRIAGMDVTGFTGPGNPATNDVTKIHMHADSIFGIHVLNVYKGPSQDDSELVIQPARGLLRGVWDDDDETVNPMNPAGGSTLTLSSQLDNLCNDNLWIVIHGDLSVVENPGTFSDRVLGGQIVRRDRSDACDD